MSGGTGCLPVLLFPLSPCLPSSKLHIAQRVNGSGYSANSQGEWSDWSLKNGASPLALSAHRWGLPELFRGALEPCWDNCFLCSSFLLFLSDAVVGLSSWQNFGYCWKRIVSCTIRKGGEKRWMGVGRNCPGHWKYQLLNFFHLYLQSKLQSSWPSSVWKSASPVCGSLLLVEWACKNGRGIEITQHFHLSQFFLWLCACLFSN